MNILAPYLGILHKKPNHNTCTLLSWVFLELEIISVKILYNNFYKIYLINLLNYCLYRDFVFDIIFNIIMNYSV